MKARAIKEASSVWTHGSIMRRSRKQVRQRSEHMVCNTGRHTTCRRPLLANITGAAIAMSELENQTNGQTTGTLRSKLRVCASALAVTEHSLHGCHMYLAWKRRAYRNTCDIYTYWKNCLRTMKSRNVECGIWVLAQCQA